MKHLLSILLVIITRNLSACVCDSAQWSSYEIFQAGHIIAIAKVNSISQKPGGEQEILFQVIEQYSGGSKKEQLKVSNDENCGFPFDKEQEYLIYPKFDANSKTFSIDICYRKPLLSNSEEARQDLLDIKIERVIKSVR